MDSAISVLIPTYNCAPFIGEAIESVLRQTLTPLEILVADDGSTDGSGDIAARYPEVRYFHQTHQGISATRNSLINAAKGDWIAFLDADDRWMPDKLEKQMKYLDSHPSCEIVYCRYRNFTDIPKEKLTQRQKRVLAVTVDQNLACACISRSVFERCGLFDTRYDYGEDTEWTARLMLSGTNVYHCVEEILYERRVHTSNITLLHDTLGRNEYLSLLADAVRNARNQGKNT